MKYRILISAPYFQPVVERFRKLFDQHEIELLIPEVRERLEEKELLPLVGDIDGVICGDDRFTERVLQQAPRLRIISKWGTGVDSIDQAACQRLGIEVRNTPNAFSEPVADSVFGYILCFARQLPWMDRAVKGGEWRKTPSHALRERVLGVIGVGSVGKAVVRRTGVFGMKVLGNDIVEIPKSFIAETGITMVSKEELLRQADFVSINCDLNSTSYHLLSDKEFAMMKRTAVVINTARGAVIDEAALVRSLKDRIIAGAALDVFEKEPLPAESPLREMEHVLIAPHNANSSHEAWDHVHENTVRNLLEGLERQR